MEATMEEEMANADQIDDTEVEAKEEEDIEYEYEAEYYVFEGKVSMDELLEQCKGQSCLFDLPNPEFLYSDFVNRSRRQDVHSLECVVEDCKNICTKIHPLCKTHAKIFKVVMDKSTIPEAGVGIFLTTSVREGTHLMDYTGIIRDATDLFTDYQEMSSRTFYEVGIDDDTSLDARSTVCGLGRYINHHPNPDCVNTQFEFDEIRQLYRITATKDILVSPNGKVELFLDYGENYWDGMTPVIPKVDPANKPVTMKDAQKFTEPEDFHVFPSYTSLNWDKDFYENRKQSIKQLVERCKSEIVLMPLEKTQMLLTQFMDLAKRQNIYQVRCVIKNCKTVCTYTHPLCKRHLKHFYIDVRTSTIPKAEKGVFLLKSVRKGTALMLFTGCFQSSDELYKIYKKNKAEFYYLFEGTKGFAIDARSTVSGIGRYVNHQSKEKANVELQARPNETFYLVVAKHDILVPKGGSVELFADYGDAYWANRKCYEVTGDSALAMDQVNVSNDDQIEPFIDQFPVVPAYNSIW